MQRLGHGPRDFFAAEPMETVRIGIVGVGSRGTGHVNIFSRIEGAQITAVCDIRPGHARRAKKIISEETRFVFRADAAGARVIDRITTLTALEERVRFPDTKEGMLGLRVRRALEMPADEAVRLTDASGEPAGEPVMDNEGVTGHYQSSEGVEGYPDVWGTRARWMMLSGEVEGRPVTLAILDHPGNVGFPTYWHAHDYGLFAANPLGQKVFSEGEKTLGFSRRAASTVSSFPIIPPR